MSEIVRAWVFLLMMATVYDRLIVDRIERRKPPLGVTAWEVVVGVGFTAFVFGMLAGWDDMLLSLFLFSGSGILMIVGSYGRHYEMAGQ